MDVRHCQADSLGKNDFLDHISRTRLKSVLFSQIVVQDPHQDARLAEWIITIGSLSVY